MPHNDPDSGQRRHAFAVIAAVGVAALAPLVFSQQAPSRPRVRSKVSIYRLADRSVQVLSSADGTLSAPNWSPDGRYLLLNSEGSLWRLRLAGDPRPEKVDLGELRGCNNDHGISPDGKWFAISAWLSSTPSSHIYISSSDGSRARLMTPKAPSYYHAWSPDGRWLAFTARRDDNFDLYRISVAGGDEQRLTSHSAYDDGPDYSPDGKWIYFNSQRSGSWDIWRIPAAGAGPEDRSAERITSDEYEDWFPHPSPDGKWMVFLSFAKGTQGHPANQDAQLRLMPLPGAKLGRATPAQMLVKLFGGQGTINVPSWSPDSSKFAFVSYELLAP